MFGILGDIAKGLGQVVGVVTGTVLGIALPVVAATLGITLAMAKEATEAGCETYEEIEVFFWSITRCN